MPHISVTSVHVNDQERALTFYTDVLGFETKGGRIVQPPMDMGPVWTMIVDDTCGNLI